MPSAQGAFQPPSSGPGGSFQGSQPMMMFDPTKFQNISSAPPSFQPPVQPQHQQPHQQPQQQSDPNVQNHQAFSGGFQPPPEPNPGQPMNDQGLPPQGAPNAGFQNDPQHQQQSYDYYSQYNQQQGQQQQDNSMYNNYHWDGYNYNYVSSSILFSVDYVIISRILKMHGFPMFHLSKTEKKRSLVYFF